MMKKMDNIEELKNEITTIKERLGEIVANTKPPEKPPKTDERTPSEIFGDYLKTCANIKSKG